MKLYLAGPMRGIPNFNFPAFHKAAAILRKDGHYVFSPAERDIERHNGVDISADNPMGDEAVAAKAHGFNLRTALGEDLAWITAEAEGIALLPGWEKSRGAIAEYATAVALGLEVVRLIEEGDPRDEVAIDLTVTVRRQPKASNEDADRGVVGDGW